MENIGEVIRRVQSGDLESYDEVVERFRSSAFNRAYARLNDRQLAEDAVQEAFFEAYRNINSLTAPDAFPTWFQKILITACSRMTRRKTLFTIPLTGLQESLPGTQSPWRDFERKERDRLVHTAIQCLPDSQRTVTAFYFIGGMSQREIAAYLGIPTSAVKKRLYDARKTLRKYLVDMSRDKVEDPSISDGSSARVIAELVSRPQLLFIKDHPVRSILDHITDELPEFDVIESSEIEQRDIFPSIREAYLSEYGGGYCLDSETMLRTHTSGTTLRAIEGKKPPVRLLTAGRVFRPSEKEDDLHLKVFHQLDVIYVGRGATIDRLMMSVERVLSSVIDMVDMRYCESDYRWVDAGMDVDVKVNGEWIGVAGCGMLKTEMLREAGHDPRVVGGYAFGLGLERLAQVQLGIEAIHELWRPPYVQLV